MPKSLPYPEDPGQTHWQGCFRSRGHHNCAIAEVERLKRELAEEIEERKRCETDLDVTRNTYETIVKTVEQQLAERPTTWAYGQACKALRKAHNDQDLIIKQVLRLVPERERWLWENRRALLAVLNGCVQAVAGELVLSDGPDLEANVRLIEDMEKDEDPGITVEIIEPGFITLLGLLGGIIGIIALCTVGC